MERNCLNCIWFNKEKIHCDYDFGSTYKPYFLDDDNNFIDDNGNIIYDINITEDFKCHKYYEKPPKKIKSIDLLQDYKNIVEKIKEYVISELEKRYDDIKFDDYDSFLLLRFNIKKCTFVINLENNHIFIGYFYAGNFKHENSNVETFEELFRYIDDVIEEEE